jgi:hypothetical protein
MMLEPIERSKEAVRFLKTIEKIYLLKDIDAILDQILLEARKLARADAGSIFLKQGDRLRFSYVHNDTLFRQESPCFGGFLQALVWVRR